MSSYIAKCIVDHKKRYEFAEDYRKKWCIPPGGAEPRPYTPPALKRSSESMGEPFISVHHEKVSAGRTDIVLPALFGELFTALDARQSVGASWRSGRGSRRTSAGGCRSNRNDPLFDCPRHRVRRVGGDGVRVGKAAQAAGRLRGTRIAPEDGRELFAGDGRIRKENTLRRAGDDAAERGPGDRLFIPAAGRRFTQKNAYPRRSLSIKQRRSPSARGRAF